MMDFDGSGPKLRQSSSERICHKRASHNESVLFCPTRVLSSLLLALSHFVTGNVKRNDHQNRELLVGSRASDCETIAVGIISISPLRQSRQGYRQSSDRICETRQNTLAGARSRICQACRGVRDAANPVCSRREMTAMSAVGREHHPLKT